MNIKKVVVIGSGTMGSGIAAQVANAGIHVYLLDISSEISQNACKRIKKSRPPLLMDESLSELIHSGYRQLSRRFTYCAESVGSCQLNSAVFSCSSLKGLGSTLSIPRSTWCLSGTGFA